MNRLIALAFVFLLALATPATAQAVFPTPNGTTSAGGAIIMCPKTGANPVTYVPCDATNPAAVSSTFTPSGTQNVNLTQILGAAPSLTNPLWITPATGATFGLAAGAAIIGKVGIDQTTAVTTNGVVIAPTATAGAGITPVVSASAEATHVLKASAGNLYSVYATNLTATTGFLTVLNATSAPADGAITPLECVPLPPNASASITYNSGPPAVFSTGITAVITSATTCFTKTTGVITGFIKGAIQ